MDKSEEMNTLIERLAAVEHERWAGWMKWEHRPEVTDADCARWARQSDTPYSELSEREKEYDRIEVRKTLVELSKSNVAVPRELLGKLKEFARAFMCYSIDKEDKEEARGSIRQAERLLKEGRGMNKVDIETIKKHGAESALSSGIHYLLWDAAKACEKACCDHFKLFSAKVKEARMLLDDAEALYTELKRLEGGE
jgi:hypothetical protein